MVQTILIVAITLIGVKLFTLSKEIVKERISTKYFFKAKGVCILKTKDGKEKYLPSKEYSGYNGIAIYQQIMQEIEDGKIAKTNEDCKPTGVVMDVVCTLSAKVDAINEDLEVTADTFEFIAYFGRVNTDQAIKALHLHKSLQEGRKV